MATYNYFPSTYQPFGQGYYQTLPVMQQNQQSFNPSQTTQSSIIWISGGEKEAALYPVAPNNAVTLWSTTEPVVYLKQADASGKPSMKTYDLVERTESPVSAQGNEVNKQTPYATKEDLSHVTSTVKGIDEVVSTLRTDIETIKSDMYGIAGKKKQTRQKPSEVEDDE